MSRPLRILFVEDSPADAQLMLGELRQAGYEPTYERVETAEAMAAALEKQTFDLVLADYRMPNFTGVKALEVLKATGLDLPFIIVSGQIGEDVAVAAMKAGAHDYLMKSSLARLAPAVERELREAVVRRERRQAEEDRARLVEQLRAVNEEMAVRAVQLQEQADKAGQRAAELDALFEASGAGLAIYGPDGKVLRSNAIAGDLVGVAPEQSIGSIEAPRVETSEGKPLMPEESPAQRALRGETVCGVEIVFRQPWRKKAIRTSVNAAPIRAKDGLLLGAVVVFSDLTPLPEP